MAKENNGILQIGLKKRGTDNYGQYWIPSDKIENRVARKSLNGIMAKENNGTLHRGKIRGIDNNDQVKWSILNSEWQNREQSRKGIMAKENNEHD